jgi:SOS-response transcriptional repressor LexA
LRQCKQIVAIFADDFSVASCYLLPMNDKWFKHQQKLSGVTADQIAARLGRHGSTVSKIYSGHKRMTMDWAKAFADALGVSLDQVLEQAGELEPQEARQLTPGFSEADAAPWRAAPDDRHDAVALAMGQRPGVDVWKIKGAAMALMGFLPDDFMLVDTHKSELVRAGDVVVAQIYDWASGTARTVLRRFEPPVLVAASASATEHRVHVVDGNNVVIKGKVVASWRRD